MLSLRKLMQAETANPCLPLYSSSS